MKDDKTGDELPPLPEPAHTQVETYSGIAMNKVVETPLYTDDQMRAYAAAAVAREREQWEKVSRISIPTKTMEQEIAARVRRAVARERELCAMACDARDMGDGSREDQEARRCAEAIRKGG